MIPEVISLIFLVVLPENWIMQKNSTEVPGPPSCKPTGSRPLLLEHQTLILLAFQIIRQPLRPHPPPDTRLQAGALDAEKTDSPHLHGRGDVLPCDQEGTWHHH